MDCVGHVPPERIRIMPPPGRATIADATRILNKDGKICEMAIKREEYFQAGVEMVWEVDPTTRTIEVYPSLDDKTTLTTNDTLDGGPILPGFQLPLKDLFAELDRQRLTVSWSCS
jgi:hypothetical protein